MGLTSRHGVGHMTRALMEEGVAFSLKDSLEIIHDLRPDTAPKRDRQMTTSLPYGKN